MRRASRGWPIPIALIALSLVPLLAGALRLVELSGGPALIPPDRRFEGFPVPLVAHIVGAGVYALVGSLQFVPSFRRRHMLWHRRAGRLLAVAGLTVAGSALWMTLLYEQKPGTGDLLFIFRLVFATAMVTALVLGLRAARGHDIPTHRAWMIRAYAIGLGAGTQVFTEGFGEPLLGAGEVRGDLCKGGAWLINLTIAEVAIRRTGRRGQPLSTAPRAVTAS
jgi:hypothetical protein